MIQKSPILITGIARSGASMIAGAINVCGAFGGYMGFKGSKRGMFENVRIKESLVKPYFLCIDADPEGQYPLPKSFIIPENWKEQVIKAIVSDGYVKGPWMYKDSRIGLMWQVWHQAFPDAKWVVVRRRTGDVVKSCIKTGFMKAFKSEERRNSINVTTEEEGWLWWVHEYEKRFIEMTEAGVQHKVIWPERMLHEDYRQLHELMEWLELPWKEEALECITALLWGNRQKRKEEK